MKKIYFLSLLTTLLFSVVSFAQTPIITAIVDGDCSGGNPKLLEIYASGTVDFSLYSLENQTNANTTWGAKQDLSSLGIVTNAFVYVATTGSAAALTSDFPSVGSVLASGTINLNGDDRIRIILTSDSTVIDQFGVSNESGTGKDWEYLDSYAKRKNGTIPNGQFNIADWTFGGKGFFDTKGVCQSGADTFETLMGGIGTFTTTASTSPEISVGNAITDLTYFFGNGPSTEKEFSVSGINLTADIVINSPQGFEVSLTSETGFGSSISISPSNGTVAATTVYVRLQAGLAVNSYTGDINLTSTGATSKTVALSGQVLSADPQFYYTEFLDDFVYTIATGGPSAEQDFRVEGLFLTDNLIVTAPVNYEVSLTSGSGFGNSVSLSLNNGNVAETPIYIRLAAGLSEGNYTGDIVISSTGVANKMFSVNGNVFGAATNSMVITGVFDGPLTGGTPKGIEIFVLKDIPDLSKFGISAIINGTGTLNGSARFSFPTGAATAGTFIYVASEAPNFEAFFGFAPTYTSGTVAVNGDDAFELVENGQIIDVFGEVSVDGTGRPWEYLDGWAYRKSNTGPEGITFNDANWTYSGVDGLEGGTTNSTTTTPFPIGTYTNATASIKNNTIEGFAVYPNPVKNQQFTITSNSAENKQVAIFNVLGKQVFSTNFSGSKTTINAANLSSGIYILKVSEGTKSATSKLVIQ